MVWKHEYDAIDNFKAMEECVRGTKLGKFFKCMTKMNLKDETDFPSITYFMAAVSHEEMEQQDFDGQFKKFLNTYNGKDIDSDVSDDDKLRNLSEVLGFVWRNLYTIEENAQMINCFIQKNVKNQALRDFFDEFKTSCMGMKKMGKPTIPVLKKFKFDVDIPNIPSEIINSYNSWSDSLGYLQDPVSFFILYLFLFYIYPMFFFCIVKRGKKNHR